MSGSEGSSTKQSTSRVSQGRLDGASEGGNAWLAVTTADARIPIKNQTGKVPVFFNCQRLISFKPLTSRQRYKAGVPWAESLETPAFFPYGIPVGEPRTARNADSHSRLAFAKKMC